MASTTTKKLTDAERKDLKLQWRDIKRGKYRSGKFRSGQAVKWKGREWLIWDFEAEMDEPEGFWLVLVSPDGEYVAQGVSVGEVKLMNQSLDLIIATELMKVAERLAASETLVDYAGDDEELADDLEAALTYFLDGSSDVNDSEIIFHEEATRDGEPVQIEVMVNPRNQPKKTGEVIVGLYITGQDGDGPTYEDGMWSFDITDTVKEVAKTIGQAAQKVLKRF